MISTLKLNCPLRDEEIALIEAALYVAGRPLSVDALRSVTGCSRRRTRQILETLIDRYSKPDTPFEILQLNGERYVFQLRPGFLDEVKKISSPLAGKGALKTLALIAYQQPITQKDVVAVRGGNTYAHTRILEGLGLIIKEKYGRTRLMRTSEAFADLFGFSYDLRALKAQLRTLLVKSEGKIGNPVTSSPTKVSS